MVLPHLAKMSTSLPMNLVYSTRMFSAGGKARPIKKLMAANRGEIAIRIFRAATELGIRSVGIYSTEDFRSMHRYKADESYLVGRGKNPVQAYLSSEDIVQLAVEKNVDAIHPGYGFLSENSHFAELCEQNGITFIGPRSETLRNFGDKTIAREMALKSGVPVVPGSEGAVGSLEEAQSFAETHGFPIIIKAAFGGGGRGMRVVRSMADLKSAYERATSEATQAFGDGTIFLEKYIERPRHIEVQVLGDEQNVVHFYERDCSVQRRHQKVVEVAPAVHLRPDLRERLLNHAVELTKASGYRSAGTVEFLVDPSQENYYFIEVNPRIQVEHTVTECVTGVDLVQSQIRIASGETLNSLNLQQENISCRGNAIQVRVTTEDPEKNFQPDTGRLEVWRPAQGFGIRLDGGSVYTGANVSPHYDSLLMKVTGYGLDFEGASRKLRRALEEFRIRGVKTNIPFLQNVLAHDEFQTGKATTFFIDETPELFRFAKRKNRAQKALHYLGDLVINGRSAKGAVGLPSAKISPVIPSVSKSKPQDGLRQVFLRDGPEGFAKAVRNTKELLLTDTTWRDAHQSLLATRVRTQDLLAIAPYTAHAMPNLYSIEMWGGATFDVALRFLKECPWERLASLREKVPNIPFQMLLRGANAVGYTSYPDNVVHKFCALAVEHGLDVFRIFDSLNYVENLKLGIDAVGQAGGIVEAAISYTGDCAHPDKHPKYTMDYYMDLVRQLVDLNIHVLCIKDMAGLLRPESAKLLVGNIRREYPDLPIHVHTHDTAGTGVASMLACAEAGADAVDCAIDSMSGMTSQPAMGALVASLENTIRDPKISPAKLEALIDYWESVRMIYGPFESGQKSGSYDVYNHEMPGGQYTNLQFQANSLGLAGRWPQIKKAYAAANRLLGDLIKVTPSSKVVGDLAQFMAQNELSETDVVENAETLSFPSSVVEFMQGHLGQPPGGFPEPLRTRVLKGLPTMKGRPGAELPPADFEKVRAELREKYDEEPLDRDIVSALLYPQVFAEYKAAHDEFGDLSALPTRQFIEPLEVGEEFKYDIEEGKRLIVKLLAIGELNVKDGMREVYFEVNGQQRSVHVLDKSAEHTKVIREKSVASKPGSVGAPMPGVVIDVRVKADDEVEAGSPLVVLSAMKMETVVSSPVAGVVKRIAVQVGDDLQGDDLLVEIQ
eukprot:Rmarinus@m.11826